MELSISNLKLQYEIAANENKTEPRISTGFAISIKILEVSMKVLLKCFFALFASFSVLR
jgi:hypothetical protein